MIVTAEEFKRLRESSDASEYQRAATEEAPIDVWWEVLERYPEMASWVAYNKTVPEQILRKLATHENADVRWIVASKRKLPQEIMMLLVDDPDEGVRMRLVNNAKASQEVLLKLSNDPWDEVAKHAKQRLI